MPMGPATACRARTRRDRAISSTLLDKSSKIGLVDHLRRVDAACVTRRKQICVDEYRWHRVRMTSLGVEIPKPTPDLDCGGVARLRLLEKLLLRGKQSRQFFGIYGQLARPQIFGEQCSRWLATPQRVVLLDRPIPPPVERRHVIATDEGARAQLARVSVHPLRKQAFDLIHAPRAAHVFSLGDEALPLQIRNDPADSPMRHA